MNIPKTIFIVPYRDREEDKKNFENAMKYNLSDMSFYKIFYIHQKDKRLFNRGAMKNIGFLLIKRLYPNDYKDITFIFHDVDTYAKDKNTICYEAQKGTVKHFYGYEFSLGGIFSIKGSDFEISLGFPNFWGWGFEDNVMYERCMQKKLLIDRSQFYKIGDSKNIIQSSEEHFRIYNARELSIYKYETPGNLYDLYDIRYELDYIDDSYVMANITTFLCEIDENDLVLMKHDLDNGYKINCKRNNVFRKDWRINFFKKPHQKKKRSAVSPY